MKKILIEPKVLTYYFDLKVREQCKSCKRYCAKQTCPDNIESIDYYKKLLPQYNYGAIYYKSFKIGEDGTWEKVGKRSSLELHKYLLTKRDFFISQGSYFCTAFTGGSCKLCTTCSIPCKYPNKALTPLEATGINVVRLMEKFNINIKFPITDYFYRVGLLLWD